MRTEDGYIIQQCLDGNAAAFGFLVDKYKKSVYALAYSEIRNFHDAQDITQEVFIKAYRSLRTLRRWDNFMGWLYRITANLCIDWLRSDSRRLDREFIEDQDAGIIEHPAIDSYREAMVYEPIREALDSLPETYRQVLTLRYFGGMTVKEISRFLGMSSRTIDRRLREARGRLKEEILVMMSATYEQHQLPTSFTFRIVEMVKKIRIHPMPRATALPWGMSIAAGFLITVISLSPHLSILNPMAIPAGLPLPVETKVMKTGEIPVDILKASEISVIASKQGNGNDRKPEPPNPRNTALMAPHGQEDTWIEKAGMPNARSRLATCVVDGVIYVIGGLGGVATGRLPGSPLSTVEAYDPAQDIWIKKADMPTARHWLSASVVDGIIYAIGGQFQNVPGWNSTSKVEAYDPAKDEWETKADMPTHREGLTTSVVDGIIYVIGGFQNGNGVGIPTVEAYDPAKDKRTKKDDMPVGICFHTASVVDGKIYVIGGREAGSDWGDPCRAIAAVYDPASDTWEEMNGVMPSPRADLSACTVNGLIYTFGGTAFPPGNQEGLGIVEAYNPATDTWEVKADMPTARMDLSTSAIDGRIYAIGGSTRYVGTSPAGLLPTVEVYDTGLALSSVRPNGKLVRPWGAIKSD